MADLATTAGAPPSGASLLDRKMKKSSAWISGAVVLVALIGGSRLHRLPRRARSRQRRHQQRLALLAAGRSPAYRARLRVCEWFP